MVKNINLVIIILISFLSYKNINSTLIKEGYHFFDSFYYKDLYKNYKNQKEKNRCTIDDGPNCYFIPKNKHLIYSELKNFFPNYKSFSKESEENIINKLKNITQTITNKDMDIIQDKIMSFDSPLVMSLFLTFESYDEKTKLNDIYSPETIDTQFDIGRLTLTILGKLRISQRDAKLYESPNTILEAKDEKPKGSYAFVESKEVLIKFNSKSTIVSMYIKKNKFNTQNKNFYLYGYRDQQKYLITKIQNVPRNHWIKINGDGKKYDSILLIRGFDYDNIVINSQVTKDNAIDYNKINRKYSEVINSKINGAIQDVMKQIKSGDVNTINKDGKKYQIIKIDLNQNDILEENQEDDFDIPEELMDEIEKNENKNKKGEIQNYKEEINLNKPDL